MNIFFYFPCKRKAFATATSTPKNALLIIGTDNANANVVVKHNVKNNSAFTIANLPKCTIRTTFEYQGSFHLFECKPQNKN